MIVRKNLFLSILCLLIGSMSASTLSESVNFFWNFQQPTYLVDKENITKTSYICDSEESTCKVNFDFRTSIPTDAPSTHYACLIDFGFGITGEENKCNPNTVEFPVGTWSVRLQVKKISDETIVSEGALTIIHEDDSIDPLDVTFERQWQSPTYLLEKDDVSLTEYTCDSEESECKINLLVIPKLKDVESGRLTCEIASDFEFVPTADPCNPNTSSVPEGDHTITIKILDKETDVLLQTSTLTLHNPPRETTIDPTRVVTDISWQQPTHLIEKDDTGKNTYTCDSEKSECKINLLVVPKLDGKESSALACKITTNFGIEENDCNPNTFAVPTGTHEMVIDVRVAATGQNISTRTITLTGPKIRNIGGGGGGSLAQLMDLQNVGVIIQSGLDESFTCRTDICQTNLIAEVPSGVLCEWDFGSGIFENESTKNTCNPGYVKFPSNSDVILRVRDPVYPDNTIVKKVTITRKENKQESQQATELLSYITLQTKFSPTKQQTSEGVDCIVKTEKNLCHLNFTGESSTGAQKWYWDFGNGQFSERENPGIQKFPLGTYFVRLRVTRADKTHTSEYVVRVMTGTPIREPCKECASMIGKIQFSAALPNPPRTDTTEWIEIRNTSHQSFSLGSCDISDEARSFPLSGVIAPQSTLRFRQIHTGINLGNTREKIVLTCGDVVMDTFVWDFDIPTNYILTREVLFAQPTKVLVMDVIDGDTVDIVLDSKKTRARLLGIDTPETVHPHKPIEKFGKEASDFTRQQLKGEYVWVTYDTEPIDHYGRRLVYIWKCPDVFSEQNCSLFNARIISEGYGRMERRFAFRFFSQFDDLEKQAKESKNGIWSDVSVTKEMNALTKEEKDILTDAEQQKYLEQQKELLTLCQENETECPEDMSWTEVTKNMSTLRVTHAKTGYTKISGRTWDNFPLLVQIFLGDILIREQPLISDSLGNYELLWIPESEGLYRVVFRVEKEEEYVEIEENIDIHNISPHLSQPFEAHIDLQGQMTTNRWIQDEIFYCRSRSTCSVNVEAVSNRDDHVSYIWILPDGSLSEKKNPTATKIPHGDFEVILIATDMITGEVITDSLIIKHTTIPKKTSSRSSSTTKFTLDIKDAPQDIGGGVSSERKPFWIQAVLVLFLAGIGALFVFKK